MLTNDGRFPGLIGAVLANEPRLDELAADRHRRAHRRLLQRLVKRTNA